MIKSCNDNSIFNFLNKRELGFKYNYNIVKNISNNRCSNIQMSSPFPLEKCPPIFEHFYVKDFLAAGLYSDGRLSLWNMKTGKCKWIFNKFRPNDHCGATFVRIIDGKIVFMYQEIITNGEDEEDYEAGAIYVVDYKEQIKKAKNGQPPDLPFQICKTHNIAGCIYSHKDLGDGVVCLSEDGTRVKMWNLAGDCVKTMNPITGGLPYNIIAHGDFIVEISSNMVGIHCITNDETYEVNLGGAHTSFFLDQTTMILFVGVNDRPDGPLSYIDLLNKRHLTFKSKFIKPHDRITTIHVHGDFIFLGLHSGLLFAIDKTQEEKNDRDFEMGQHKYGIEEFVVDGNVLVSRGRRGNKGDIKLWDLKGFILLKEIEFEDLDCMHYEAAQLVISRKGSLWRFDFLASTTKENEEFKALEEHENEPDLEIDNMDLSNLDAILIEHLRIEDLWANVRSTILSSMPHDS